ncbi:MAG: hypothetical protein FIA95_05090 [Gemmatimonadetes bacterium]|nr:hypothetical protein [Gemmatimonadota bacterium]
MLVQACRSVNLRTLPSGGPPAGTSGVFPNPGGPLSQLRFAIAALILSGSALVPAALTAQTSTTTGPDSVVFTRRGTLVFRHAKHAEATECVTCHHASKPEKPLASEHQKCTDCHTDPPTPPMTTTLRNAMHDTEAREGLCFSCHNKEAEKGAQVPQRCRDCHAREGGGPRP